MSSTLAAFSAFSVWRASVALATALSEKAAALVDDWRQLLDSTRQLHDAGYVLPGPTDIRYAKVARTPSAGGMQIPLRAGAGDLVVGPVAILDFSSMYPQLLVKGDTKFGGLSSPLTPDWCLHK